MIIVRELNSGIYYGTPRGIEGEGKSSRGFNTMSYTWDEIERVTRMSFELARAAKNLTSVDDRMCSRPRSCGGVW
jgi:3-isopropylmalate dehydrogenase